MFTKKCASLFRLSLLFLSGILFSQSKATDFGLWGNVESMQSVTKSFRNPSLTEVSGFLDSEMYDSISLKFDRRRNVIFRENYLDYRGKLGLFDRTILQVNANRMPEKLETTLIQNGEEPRKISQRKIYYYKGAQLIRMDEFNSGRTSDQFWVTNYVYKGTQLVEKVVWMEDEIFTRVKMEYNDRNRLSAEKSFSNNGQLGKKLEFEFNSSGDLTKKVTHLGNEKTFESFLYDNDLKKKYLVTDSSGKVLHEEIYHDLGWISQVHKKNSHQNSEDFYEFEYKIDSMNNWTECIIRKNQIPEFKIIRKIKYYKQ
jgi:hypothetical protein